MVETHKRVYLFLAGAWAECRLKKLLYEDGGFTSGERALIASERTQADRWKKALELGYRKRYGVKRAALSDATVSGTAWFRYEAIRTIIAESLSPLIGLRNTLAHGQWERPLNSDETDISQLLIAQINQENALTIKFKLALIESMSSLIHDLVASTSFERDFDANYRSISAARVNLLRRDYSKWRADMIQKKQRGRQKRNTSLATS